METKPQISFIIVNYKSEGYLKRCFASIFKNAENSEKEIAIVNNCDDLISASENVRIINIPENKGFGNACNIGAKGAKGKILCFLNSDTELISNNLEKIISEFQSNKKVSIIGAKLVDENRNIQEWCAGKEITLSDIIGNNLGFKRSKKIWESKNPVECAWISGACLFIRKELFEKLNGFDENFFLYFEDIDLCKRARNLGYKILYHPEFIVKHFGGKSFNSEKKQKKLFYESQDYYFQKHFGRIQAKIIKMLRKIY
jgi:N-acetylglucosaminyl-diphospho-decaprenol L-rhamnosyltransferase